jgi:peptide/nickel transport system substrate-binding protein
VAAVAAAIAMAAGALAGCSGPSTSAGSSGASNASAASTLNVYLYQKPKQFSPLEVANGPDQAVMSLVFDSLLGPDANYKLQPHLAIAQPTISPDATTFTFKLRPGLKWSDGSPFTSKDVLFTYNLLANPASGSASSANYSVVEGYDAVLAGTAKTLSGFSAPDDNTFVIKTTTPNIGLLGLAGVVPILPEHVLGAVPLAQLAKNDFFNNPKVGMGPYEFVTYKTDQYVELRANPNYRSKVNIAHIFLKPVTSDVATAQLGTGEMDVAQISATDLPTVKAMKNMAVVAKDAPGYTRIAWNQSKAEFANPKIRQAFLYAVDRKKIVASVLGGNGTVPNDSFVGQALAAGLNDYAYNPAKAKQLLKEGGWNPATTVTLAWIPGQRDRDTTVTVVQSQLAAVGVKVVLKQMQAGDLVDSYTTLKFDMVLYAGGGYAVDPWNVHTILGCQTFYPTGGNIPHFCDKALDQEMFTANKTTDGPARAALYQQAALLENQQAAYFWLYNPQSIWAHNTRVANFQASGDFTNPFINISAWKLG